MPSNPSPEERGKRDYVVLAFRNGATCEDDEFDGYLDAYARAVYERCLRDAMAVVEASRPQQPIGAGLDTGPSLFVLDVNARLDRILAALRTLTPTESPTHE